MMTNRLRSVAAGLVVLAAGLVACRADRAPITAPAVSTVGPRASLLGGLTGTVTGLTGTLLTCSQTTQYSATQVVGPLGGVIKVGPHSLSIPAGALAENTTISAVAPIGTHVAVQFAPQGLQFRYPTTLTMSYANCGVLSGVLMHIDYVDDSGNILQTLTSLTNVLLQQVSAPVNHFSSYIIAY
jgi:hypothetical protein